MTQSELNDMLNSYISKGITQNISQYQELIEKTVDFSSSPQEIAVQSSLASASFSARLCSEIILKILDELDIISISDIGFIPAPPEFKIITGGLDSVSNTQHQDE